MRAHELIQEWKDHLNEGGSMTLGEYRTHISGNVGLGATPKHVDGVDDDDLTDIELALSDMKVRAPGKKKSVVNKPLSKKEQARTIYDDIAGKGHGRKMTIQRFIDVLGLSPAGASTYYSNIKLGKW